MQDLEQSLSFLGLSLVDISDRPPYNERKGKTYGVFQGAQMLCSYATPRQIRDWMTRKISSKKSHE
jgi:hypothetical protein